MAQATQTVLKVEDLPGDALDAAAAFHARYMEQARIALDGDCSALALVFPKAPYDHAGWRKAAVADLARFAAPKRVNGVAGNEPEAVGQALAWLAQAQGITGQLLPVDAQGAGI